MKGLRIISTAILFALVSCATSKVAQDSRPLYIADGYFFHEYPVDKKLIKRMIGIRTYNGTTAMGLLLDEPLPEEARRNAIPARKVPEADKLLEIFNENSKTLSRSFSGEEEKLKVGDAFPDFKARDLKGKKWSNVDIKGKVTVLNCWFSGCGPCCAEMPELSQWKKEMPDVMFFSSTYENAKTVRQVLKRTGFNWIPLVNDTQFKEYVGGSGYPMTVIIDKSGRIAQIEYGTSPEQRARLKQTILSLR